MGAILVPDDSLLSIGALVPLGIKGILFELDSRQSKPGFKSEMDQPSTLKSEKPYHSAL